MSNKINLPKSQVKWSNYISLAEECESDILTFLPCGLILKLADPAAGYDLFYRVGGVHGPLGTPNPRSATGYGGSDELVIIITMPCHEFI